ncbi:flagellar hook-basal body complex protein [Neptuniibacter sp.]|uniref:flagellar hook-basal body complex protein n=1 Tax=Neptuniibacter sp. TaxID=1962643 RepID=UPI00261B57AB|nr:flagellar hook-basal body complex protein [Neptuniibacter sp.]MCP4596074.1 flagellar hook-basal body complex protein [Neptuniibacter sp.]
MAGFNTAVTGLKAATTDLDVTGNNIANASTVGFKSSRTEFGDIYATAVVGAGSANVAGSGVTVSDIAQDFQAGTIEFTNNNLDLAINGSGFFQLDDGQGSTTYSRAGSFELDKDGFVVSKSGKYLQGYGLDSEDNRLPIGDLQVSEKESPPKATEEIDLSFNIDSREDAATLFTPYDKDEPSSFTYSTTVRTFDSLGNEHTIKFNMVEQPPFREVQTLDFSVQTMTGQAVVSGGTVNLANLQKGVGIDPDDADTTLGNISTMVLADGLDATGAAESLTFTIGAVPAFQITGIDNSTGAYNTPAGLAALMASRSDDIVSAYNTGGGAPEMIDVIVDPADPDNVLFRYNNGSDAPALFTIADDNEADATAVADGTGLSTIDYNAEVEAITTADSRIATVEIGGTSGDQVILRFNASAADVDDVQVRDTSSNILTDVTVTSEELSASEVHTYTFNGAAFSPTTGNLLGDANITIGGVSIQLTGGSSQQVVEDTIEANQAAIIDANPDVQSVLFNSSGQLVVTFAPESGNVNDGVLEIDFGDVDPGVGVIPIMGGTPEVETGDNSYQGIYSMYAYLNGSELLDVGKAVDPGEPGTTEPGPVLVEFNSTNGLLQSINGENVPLGGTAPSITIAGADPANPVTTISLDLSNTTQFASASIVKASTQDGYTKGDLIGVTFSETGEMVASFSNGENQNLGVVAIATFENQSGLQPSGDTEWTATLTSGAAIVNPPGTGLNGTLRSAALEQSNVDLSAELVNLIEAQRNFQANSKTLETLNTVTQNILQI